MIMNVLCVFATEQRFSPAFISSWVNMITYHHMFEYALYVISHLIFFIEMKKHKLWMIIIEVPHWAAMTKIFRRT